MSAQQAALLDDVMPRFDVNELHDTWVAASPEEAFAAVRAVTVGDIALLRGLMTLRGAPSALGGTRLPLDGSAPFLDVMFKLGFIGLAERPASELVLGAIGRFWLPAGNKPLDRIRTRDDFMGFDEPGFAKGVMNFMVTPEGSGSRISTETRVAGTDRNATIRFRLYWALIGPWSALIRRSVLRAIRERLA